MPKRDDSDNALFTSLFNAVKFDDKSRQAQRQIQKSIHVLVQKVDRLIDDSRTKTVVLQKIEEVWFWSGKAIRDTQLARELAAPPVVEEKKKVAPPPVVEKKPKRVLVRPASNTTGARLLSPSNP